MRPNTPPPAPAISLSTSSPQRHSPGRNPESPPTHARRLSAETGLLRPIPIRQRITPRSSLTDLRSDGVANGGNSSIRRPSPRNWEREKEGGTPTLVELMRAEEERERMGNGDHDGKDSDTFYDKKVSSRRESGEWRLAPPPESAILHPPLYGRPGPSPSPDLFTALLQPLLTLSRPPSPAPTPPLTPTLQSSSSVHSPLVPSPAASTSNLLLPEPLSPDRSSSSLPAHFPPRTPSDPGPTVESQGFVLYLGSLVAWILFLFWSLGTEEFLEGIGVGWYPSRDWALLVPAWTIMLAFFIYFGYIALNIFITPNLDSLHTLTDRQAYILPSPPPSPTTPNTRKRKSKKPPPHPLLANSVLLPADSVPPLHDLPIGLVNRVVFGDFRKRKGR